VKRKEENKMADTSSAIEAQKQELSTLEDTERTRDCQCFVPRADIYETDDQIVVVVDVPGASENSIDITLEKNVLTINAYVEPEDREGYALSLAEYEVGDYQRSFRLSDEVDRENIEASIKDGVLRLELAKAKEAQSRKINVAVG
jgi:HSP20 family molecular chaperone IbpA